MHSVVARILYIHSMTDRVVVVLKVCRSLAPSLFYICTKLCVNTNKLLNKCCIKRSEYYNIYDLYTIEKKNIIFK